MPHSNLVITAAAIVAAVGACVPARAALLSGVQVYFISGPLSLATGQSASACATNPDNSPISVLIAASGGHNLADSRNFQILAEADGRLVASMAMTFSAWNDSYELGRALTVPEYRRNGLAGLLMQRVVDWVAAEESGSITFGFPRVRRIAELCAALDPPIVPVGHDAGRNVANGNRETHLIVYGIPRHARFTHVIPPRGSLPGWRFVRERIYAPLGLNGSPGRYPDRCFAGADPVHRLSIDRWMFDFARDVPGGALDVVNCKRDRVNPAKIARELDEILSCRPEVQHATATILADKLELIGELCGRGFEVSAYLPAWYQEDGCRYDCVQLARRHYRGMASMQDLTNMIDELRHAFEATPLSRLKPQRVSVAVNE